MVAEGEPKIGGDEPVEDKNAAEAEEREKAKKEDKEKTKEEEEGEEDEDEEPVSPEVVAGAAVDALKSRAAADAPGPVKKAENYWKEAGLDILSVGSGISQTIIGLVWAALEIAYETAKNKGKMSFGKALDITKYRLSLESKKEKKS